jgi:hypothetical protein
MTSKYAYVHDLATAVATDASLKAAITADPVGTIENLAQKPELPDTKVYWILLSFLGSAVLISLIGILVLAYFPKNVPEGVIAIASTSVGALAGVLAPSPIQRNS